MPRPAINDYIFYKIVNINGDCELCYIGSTADFKSRRFNHKTVCNNVNDRSYNSKIYTTIREYGGWDEFKMVEVGRRDQITLAQAHIIEEHYRVELNANLNSQRCFRTHEQIKQQAKESRERNKDSEISKKRRVNTATERGKLVKCECGIEICNGSLKRHCKSQTHIDLIKNKIESKL